MASELLDARGSRLKAGRRITGRRCGGAPVSAGSQAVRLEFVFNAQPPGNWISPPRFPLVDLEQISTVQLEEATFEAIQRLGDAANADVEREVGESLGLTGADREQRTADGAMTVLGYRIAWRRTALKRRGLITSVRHGVWRPVDGSVVPKSTTAAAPRQAVAKATSPSQPPLFPWHRLSAGELLLAERQALRELKRRQIIRGKGALVGDLAEWLVAGAYDGALAPPVQRSHDVVCPDGTRIQVKARAVSVEGGAGDLALGTIRHHDYETLVGILFDAEDLAVREALEIPRNLVERHGAQRNGAFTVHLNPAVVARLLQDGARRITDRLRDVAEDLADPPGALQVDTSPADEAVLDGEVECPLGCGLTADPETVANHRCPNADPDWA